MGGTADGRPDDDGGAVRAGGRRGSGRRTHVEREIAWSDLEGRPKQQDGRTLPNSKGTMYALFAKPRRKFESEEYLLSIGAGQWASMEAARQAVQEER